MKRNFLKDTSAVAYIWALAVIGIILGAIIYFPLSFCFDAIYNSVTGQYTFSGTSASTVTIMQIAVSYLLAFVILIVVNWAFVQSKSEAYEA